MLVSLSDVRLIFGKLIDGKISREEADRWAYEKVKAFDAGSLEFESVTDEQSLWNAIKYLYGIDTKISPFEYMHSIEEIKNEFIEKWNIKENQSPPPPLI